MRSCAVSRVLMVCFVMRFDVCLSREFLREQIGRSHLSVYEFLM